MPNNRDRGKDAEQAVALALGGMRIGARFTTLMIAPVVAYGLTLYLSTR